ncbi:hypothetical protein HMPREF0058_2175, partial [Actinomyces urogenitalis DSM 15434]
MACGPLVRALRGLACLEEGRRRRSCLAVWGAGGRGGVRGHRGVRGYELRGARLGW